MRFSWFQPASHGAVGAPGALLSVAAHAAFLGAALYATGPRSSLLDFPRQQLYYLPPPDRHPAHATVEQIHFVAVDVGRPATGAESPLGQHAGGPKARREHDSGGMSGRQNMAQPAVARTALADSVYSVLSLEQSAQRVEGSAAPIYPAQMLAQGIEGVVRTRFVIDTTGRADSTSLEVLASSNDAFELAVRASLPGMRFLAANVVGHKVRQMVEQEFDFRLDIPAPPGAPAEHTRARPVP
ncbi:MAG: TonB family protein [Nitrosotalea sp.]